jgi:hypothetical protein
VDVTDKVRNATGGSSVVVVAGKELAGTDPAPNVVKKLRVEYAIEGTTQMKVARENEVLRIGQRQPWVVEPPKGAWRHVRLIQTQSGGPLSIEELEVFGRFK